MFYFFSHLKQLHSIAMCSKASCLVQLREDWIWFVSEMTFNTPVLSRMNVKHTVEAYSMLSYNQYLFKQSQPLGMSIKMYGKDNLQRKFFHCLYDHLTTCPFLSNNFLCLPSSIFKREVKASEIVPTTFMRNGHWVKRFSSIWQSPK